MNNDFKWLFLIFFSLCIASSSANSGDYIEIRNISIDNGENAIERALKYTGFGELIGNQQLESAKAEIISYSNLDIPYISQKIENSRIWRVDFRGVQLVSEKYPDVVDCPREFHIFIDSSSGILYKISSPAVGQDRLRVPNKNLDYKEDSIYQIEKYVDFVRMDSVLTFFGLFRSKILSGLRCYEIEALLVEHYYKPAGVENIKPFWILSTWGREFISNGREIEVTEKPTRSFLRRVLFDAVSGEPGLVDKQTAP